MYSLAVSLLRITDWPRCQQLYLKTKRICAPRYRKSVWTNRLIPPAALPHSLPNTAWRAVSKVTVFAQIFKWAGCTGWQIVPLAKYCYLIINCATGHLEEVSSREQEAVYVINQDSSSALWGESLSFNAHKESSPATEIGHILSTIPGFL